MKNLYYILFLSAALVSGSCSDFLDREPDRLLSDEQIFGDEKMINSALAAFYGPTNWGQTLNTPETFTKLDEACITTGEFDNMQYYDNALWRVYEYDYIRKINQFLQGLRASSTLDEKEQLQYEGEVRFLRAWAYFNMCRSLGGMPIINDEIFDYTPGMDVTALQHPRATEAEMYDYIIKECDEVSGYLLDEPTVNAARATKWAALMLKARAALYAGSIAKYNNLMPSPIKTENGEVGIPADKAEGYYKIAKEAAEEVIKSGKYQLQLSMPDDLGKNFYDAVCKKEGNKEVIWARDYIYPGNTHGFTCQNIPAVLSEDKTRCYSGAVLNLVEAYEYKNDRNGEIKISDGQGNYMYYANPEDAFADKDARLWGTVIYPGTEFKSTKIVLQAGQKYLENGKWQTKTGKAGALTSDGILLTSVNGPVNSNEVFLNKTGFFIRKFLDETDNSAMASVGSAMWFPRFRMAEAIMIACESSFELGDKATALTYINQVRHRAGIQDLKEITFDDIVHEDRVEFAFEDHRWWDLKRWRLADKVWDGDVKSPTAHLTALFPYLINDPGNPEDKKWVFDKTDAHVKYPRRFELRNYYNFLDLAWINNNPKLVKNPYQ